MDKPVLAIDGLRSGYGRVPILHGVTLEMNAGECHGVLGHNGMGKTTLLRTVAGHITATAGTIILEGHDVTRATPARRARAGMGLIPQGRQIFPQLSVRENLYVAACQVPGAEAQSIVDETLEEFPRLKPVLARAGGVLSGGEQQILALARCLCTRPRLLLMDEPTEGIQPSIIDEIRETLQRLTRSHRLSMLLVEQNLDFLMGLADRIQIIQRGELSHPVPSADFRSSGLAQEFDLQASGY